MMNLKKALVALSVALPLGGLVAVGAAHAYQQAAGERDKLVIDGRKYAAEPEFPKTYLATYYVGDLLGLPKDGQRQSLGDKPFDPIMKLITTTVAPGTWEVQSSDGQIVNGNDGLNTGTGRTRERPIGSITPFFLSVSLIVRHTEETHEQVANLLRNVRSIVDSAAKRSALLASEKDRAKSSGQDDDRLGEEKRAEPKNKKVEVTIGEDDGLTQGNELSVYRLYTKSTLPEAVLRVKSRAGATARVRLLLQQLQVELDSLDKEETPPPTNSPLKGDF